MASPGSAPSQVPPGFRFHPTDEELVNYYLRKKVAREKFDLDVIRDVDLNKLEPWDLQERCRIDSRQQTEWYFFSHKDKKYPTGTRTNRATTAGFWKATGRDKAVHSGLRRVGMRKTLVFYTGRAPHGHKTDWIMHEYRLDDCETGIGGNNEDGWVVCRVFKKRIHPQKVDQDQSRTFNIASEEEQSSLIDSNLEHSNKNFRGDQGATAAVNSETFFCKQELDDLQRYGSDVHFLHLPQLESPKNTYNIISLNSNASDHQHGRRVYCKRSEMSPLPFSLEMPTLECSSNLFTKSLFSCEDNLTDTYGANDVHLNEWNNVLETMNPREMRFSSELSNFSTDLPALPQLGSLNRMQQAAEFANNSEVDLWGFLR